MTIEEKCTVKIYKYAVIDARVTLFDVYLNHATFFDQHKKISSAGLACIWKKGNKTQVICCDEGCSYSVLSKPETDQQLIATYLGIEVNSILSPENA